MQAKLQQASNKWIKEIEVFKSMKGVETINKILKNPAFMPKKLNILKPGVKFKAYNEQKNTSVMAHKVNKKNLEV